MRTTNTEVLINRHRSVDQCLERISEHSLTGKSRHLIVKPRFGLRSMAQVRERPRPPGLVEYWELPSAEDILKKYGLTFRLRSSMRRVYRGGRSSVVFKISCTCLEAGADMWETERVVGSSQAFRDKWGTNRKRLKREVKEQIHWRIC